MIPEEAREMTYNVLPPIRFKIVNLLLKEAPLYIAQIAEKIGEERRLVSYHLTSLSKAGIVEAEWKLENPKKSSKGAPKAVKYYKLTDKAESVIPLIINQLSNLSPSGIIDELKYKRKIE
nr:ArsR family transcriptional regulator [Candidatus Freyarchaeota archaeon]